ncbi:MAG: cephalosporin hydroxylase family protein [Saprospiraceae bacterium]|jgi:cephalosporin hydroxylase|nr:cephalosporin hydroxylase family protein [Saprospiraceae bacterium]MBL0261949.1 cephalosporin hydroxylase family protein [Saprospiraceae bacterium]MBX7164194.1 cephalosporin hydroxylase family protein [Saprospiraceae bacterium]
MNPELIKFYNEKQARIASQEGNIPLQKAKDEFIFQSINSKYSYNFSWLGRPIIAYPQDMIAMQEIIWRVKPDLIIETGVAHGGSIVYYASLLELLGGDRMVLGIDIDIRQFNRELIESHPMSKRIILIQGSSTSDTTVNSVKSIVKGYKNILVCLDSNHTHDHVYRELKVYSEFVTLNSYMVVFDTIIEHLPKDQYIDRPWDVGDNPMTALQLFLEEDFRYEIDHEVDNKILISVAPSGYLKRVK